MKRALIISGIIGVAVITTGYSYQGHVRYENDKRTLKVYEDVVVLDYSVALPGKILTPGEANPKINQTNIKDNICNKNWTTDSVRPPVSYTNRIKLALLKDMGYDESAMKYFVLDHVFALQNGGHPTSPKNLFLQRKNLNIAGYDYGSRTKDRIETRLKGMICNGYISLADAQKAVSEDWVAVYRKYIGELPSYRVDALGGGEEGEDE